MAERVQVQNLKAGMKTDWYTLLEDARKRGEEVRARVRYHDGGDGERVWDHPGIEIEVQG